MPEINNSEIIMYQTEDGLTKIESTFDGDTVWLSIDQMAELFGTAFTVCRAVFAVCVLGVVAESAQNHHPFGFCIKLIGIFIG